MKLWIFPTTASHNEFWTEVEDDNNIVCPATVQTAYEVLLENVSERDAATIERLAHQRGWPTQREGEDYKN